ncbi:BRO family protein [Corynebacterium qintianiae]|uniref:BRO family protein n=1 Tax=Corynebacterium qintianiae TaxID=2709392 RepID=UPI0013EDC0D8|nr:BRO family protein [Corynebacterium qintianiae]
MNNHPVPVNASSNSPFDAIKNTTTAGQEYWSARELMPMLGYDKWERFAGAIDRARLSIEAQGMNPETEASRLREPFGKTRQMGDNFHLSRFACYLVAMNGDPRKPEIAAAQAYFAIRTRQAETAPEMTREELLARAVLESQAAIEEQAAELEAVTVENRALKGGDGIRIKDFIKTYFTVPNERAFFEWFYEHGYLIDGRLTDDEGRALRYGSGPKLRWDHMHPSYRGRKYFKLVPSGNNKWGAQRTRVIPERALDLVQLLLKASDLPTEMTREGRRAMDEYQRPGQLRIVSNNIA